MTGGKKAATAGFFRIIEKQAEAGGGNARAEFSCENTESGVKIKKLSLYRKALYTGEET